MEENRYLEQVEEVKYLAQENTPRYRLIMRFLFSKYEEAEYWLYKEEICDELKKTILNYSLDECERDLEFLLSNGSITRLQDTQNINTISDFKFHNFRYQMTDKAVIVERMTRQLEELEVKVASLEPRLFERIGNLLKRLADIGNLEEEQIFEVWNDLNNDFKSLNEHYQDFLKKFYEAKTEELLQSDAFLEFKSSVINYINEFINSYIKNATLIKGYLIEFDEKCVSVLMDKLISYQKKAPKISTDFDYDKLKRVNFGKWQSLKKWFLSSNRQSEGERLLEATQNVIQKIYRYASSLIELHGNMVNRKEEYKYICHLFDDMDDIRDASRLSESIFGVLVANHYRIPSMINTDSLIKSYDVPPFEIFIDALFKEYKVKNQNSQIIDKSKEKDLILKSAMEKDRLRKEKIYNLIKDGKIILKDEINLDEDERRYVLSLIEKNGVFNKESEFGYKYSITDESADKCKIISPDGVFLLNSRVIMIEAGELNGW